mmetsp:Transcript_26965/g.54244  ORF Transcript_26965/g.54244 Transcript_26965/m.54244 type:complete len:280 (+) Transcript_26965:447-1286(+)
MGVEHDLRAHAILRPKPKEPIPLRHLRDAAVADVVKVRLGKPERVEGRRDLHNHREAVVARCVGNRAEEGVEGGSVHAGIVLQPCEDGVRAAFLAEVPKHAGVHHVLHDEGLLAAEIAVGVDCADLVQVYGHGQTATPPRRQQSAPTLSVAHDARLGRRKRGGVPDADLCRQAELVVVALRAHGVLLRHARGRGQVAHLIQPLVGIRRFPTGNAGAAPLHPREGQVYPSCPRARLLGVADALIPRGKHSDRLHPVEIQGADPRHFAVARSVGTRHEGGD